MADLNQTLFASGQQQAAPTGEKPSVVTAAGAAIGIKLADTQGLIPDAVHAGNMFKSPEEGGRAMLSLSSKPLWQAKNWVEKILASAAKDIGIGNIKTDNSGGGGGSGGSSSGSTSTASAPVSSGGGGAAGGGGGTATASSGGGTGGSSFRGGSSDGSLETAVASARGVMDLAAMNANLIGPAVHVHMDHTPTAAAPTPPVAAIADDGHSRFG